MTPEPEAVMTGASVDLCPECGVAGGGIPCGHYFDAIELFDGLPCPESTDGEHRMDCRCEP